MSACAHHADIVKLRLLHRSTRRPISEAISLTLSGFAVPPACERVGSAELAAGLCRSARSQWLSVIAAS